MKKTFVIIMIFLFSLLLVSCDSNDIKTYEYEKLTVSEAVNRAEYEDFYNLKINNFQDYLEIISKKEESIPFDDYSLIMAKMADVFIEEDKNFVVSPLSLYLGIACLYEIGDDIVKQGINEIFGINDKLISNTKNLMNVLKNQVANLYLCNSVWLQKNIKLKQEGLDNLANKLMFDVYRTDFEQENNEANQDINRYIKNTTNGFTQSNHSYDEAAQFILINDLYYKYVFSKELETTEMNFKGSKGEYKTEFLIGTPQNGEIGETETSRFFYIRCGNYLKLTMFIPKEGYSLKDTMTEDNINVINNYQYDQVGKHPLSQIIFPSFSIKNKIMSDCFGNNMLDYIMDLFEVNICGDVSRSPIIEHDVEFKINKKGVEGSSSTRTTEIISSGPKDVENQLIIDQSFGFIFSYKNIIIFAGQVLDTK